MPLCPSWRRSRARAPRRSSATQRLRSRRVGQQDHQPHRIDDEALAGERQPAELGMEDLLARGPAALDLVTGPQPAELGVRVQSLDLPAAMAAAAHVGSLACVVVTP
jgi:hypothetical protein